MHMKNKRFRASFFPRLLASVTPFAPPLSPLCHPLRSAPVAPLSPSSFRPCRSLSPSSSRLVDYFRQCPSAAPALFQPSSGPITRVRPRRPLSRGHGNHWHPRHLDTVAGLTGHPNKGKRHIVVRAQVRARKEAAEIGHGKGIIRTMCGPMNGAKGVGLARLESVDGILSKRAKGAPGSSEG